jgi:ABC-2 type transport system permease protein
MPRFITRTAEYLPFRFMLSAPVEIMTRSLDGDRIAFLLGGQLAWTAVLLVVALFVWRTGVRRFEAVGG